jgi:hypothetical protein
MRCMEVRGLGMLTPSLAQTDVPHVLKPFFDYPATHLNPV